MLSKTPFHLSNAYRSIKKLSTFCLMQGMKYKKKANINATTNIPRINKYGIILSSMLVEFIPNL